MQPPSGIPVIFLFLSVARLTGTKVVLFGGMSKLLLLFIICFNVFYALTFRIRPDTPFCIRTPPFMLITRISQLITLSAFFHFPSPFSKGLTWPLRLKNSASSTSSHTSPYATCCLSLAISKRYLYGNTSTTSAYDRCRFSIKVAICPSSVSLPITSDLLSDDGRSCLNLIASENPVCPSLISPRKGR